MCAGATAFHSRSVLTFSVPWPGTTMSCAFAATSPAYSLAAVIGAINSLLFAVAVTVGAFVYNVSADLVGGIEVTKAIAEVKQDGVDRASGFMQQMHGMALHPTSFSKYCIGVALLFPGRGQAEVYSSGVAALPASRVTRAWGSSMPR